MVTRPDVPAALVVLLATAMVAVVESLDVSTGERCGLTLEVSICDGISQEGYDVAEQA